MTVFVIEEKLQRIATKFVIQITLGRGFERSFGQSVQLSARSTPTSWPNLISLE